MIAAVYLLAPTITLAFVGDVMVGRRAQLDKAAAKIVRAADWSFANLECALTVAPPVRRKLVNLQADPKRATWLTELGLDCVSIANNHAGDCGDKGLADTLACLAEQGIAAAGVRDRSVIQRVQGRAIGVLAFTDFPRDTVKAVAIANAEVISRSVRNLRPKCDLLIASFHWGVEGAAIPNGRQKRFAKLAAQAGADIVVGHGPHKVQPIERVGKALVAYSLGDFVFDRKGERVIWTLTWKASQLSYRLVPMVSEAKP